MLGELLNSQKLQLCVVFVDLRFSVAESFHSVPSESAFRVKMIVTCWTKSEDTNQF